MISDLAWTLIIGGSVMFALSFVLPRLQVFIEGRRARTSDLPSLPSPIGPTPSIEVIIPAYLESSVIAGTIARLQGSLLAYGGEGSVTVVASDAETARAAVGADRVIEVAREGKAAAANAGVARSMADVIVLTDANCEITPSKWPDLAVAALTERHLVSANKTESTGAEKSFWAMERIVKGELFSDIGTVSVVGEFMAFRRSDFRAIPRGTILDDLWVATDFVDRGFTTGIAPSIGTVELGAVASDQWQRRVRIAEGLFAEQLIRTGALAASAPGRLFLAHKLYRVTIGCVGFWLAALGAMIVTPPLSLLIALAIAGAVAVYRGWIPAPRVIAAIAAPIGMQAIPVLAAWKVASGQSKSSGVWEKIAR